MHYQATTALKKIRALKKRLKIIQGGSSAGKTIAILLILIDRAQRQHNKVFSVVSETVPHLKRGAIRDFLNIMEAHGYYKDDRWNRSDFTYVFETGSKIEFFSADSPDKVRGPRRNGDLFINECNNINFETYTQLAIRTEGDIFLDYNPVSEFWVHDDIIAKQVDHDFLIVTYKDNEGLPQVIVDEIESRRGNKSFWRVYGEGQLGEAEGRIYTGWNIIDEVPHEARLQRYGLNFGYSLHPAAACGIYTYNTAFVIDQVLYGLGYKNRQIADVFKNLPSSLIAADSAEPKSIDELREYGLNIIGVSKGKDSVRHGILYVQDQRIFITKRSVDFIKEYRNYLWERDRNGAIILEPQEPFHYSMDAVRYGIVGVQPVPPEEEIRRQRQLMHNQQQRLTATKSDAGL